MLVDVIIIVHNISVDTLNTKRPLDKSKIVPIFRTARLNHTKPGNHFAQVTLIVSVFRKDPKSFSKLFLAISLCTQLSLLISRVATCKVSLVQFSLPTFAGKFSMVFFTIFRLFEFHHFNTCSRKMGLSSLSFTSHVLAQQTVARLFWFKTNRLFPPSFLQPMQHLQLEITSKSFSFT